jgi:membrane associated rhomboid family serine protease
VGVGASGAIFGLFGAFYVVARRLGGETRSILTLLVINLVITFTVPIIDWRAHLGGLVTGTAVAAALAYAPRGPRRTAVQVAACVAVLVLLAVAVAVRSRVLAG